MAKGLSEYYTAELRAELSYLATWYPSDRISLGDIGVMDGSRFVPRSTLEAAVGIPAGDSKQIETGEISYRSAGAVTLSTAANAKTTDLSSALVTAGADVDVSFSRKNAVLVDLHGCRSKRVADQLALQRQLLAAWERKEWDPEWCAITEVVKADSATVLISRAAGARIGLKASAALDVAGEISLAGVGLKLQRIYSRGVGLELLAQPGATPLVKGLRLKERFWRKKPSLVIEGLEHMGDEEPFEDGGMHCAMFSLLGDE